MEEGKKKAKKTTKKYVAEVESKEERDEWVRNLISSSQLSSAVSSGVQISKEENELLKNIGGQLSLLLEQFNNHSILTSSLSQQVGELSTQLLEAKEELNLEKKNRIKMELKMSEIDARISHCKEIQKQLEFKITAKRKKKKGVLSPNSEKESDKANEQESNELYEVDDSAENLEGNEN